MKNAACHDATRLATSSGFSGPMLGVPQHACPPIVGGLLTALKAPLCPRGDILFISPAVHLHLHSFGIHTPASIMLEWPPIIYLSQCALCPFPMPFHMHQRTLRVHLQAPWPFATSRHMPDEPEAMSVRAGACDRRGSRKK